MYSNIIFNIEWAEDLAGSCEAEARAKKKPLVPALSPVYIYCNIFLHLYYFFCRILFSSKYFIAIFLATLVLVIFFATLVLVIFATLVF